MFVVKKKVVPLHSLKGTNTDSNNKLGYGVMVTLQILVLSFLVRVRVSQHRDILIWVSFFLYIYSLLSADPLSAAPQSSLKYKIPRNAILLRGFFS